MKLNCIPAMLNNPLTMNRLFGDTNNTSDDKQIILLFTAATTFIYVLYNPDTVCQKAFLIHSNALPLLQF